MIQTTLANFTFQRILPSLTSLSAATDPNILLVAAAHTTQSPTQGLTTYHASLIHLHWLESVSVRGRPFDPSPGYFRDICSLFRSPSLVSCYLHEAPHQPSASLSRVLAGSVFLQISSPSLSAFPYINILSQNSISPCSGEARGLSRVLSLTPPQGKQRQRSQCSTHPLTQAEKLHAFG